MAVAFGVVSIELVVVDAFTDRAFTGNPAAVAVLEGFGDDVRLHAVAAEMNLSETAFVVPRPDGDHDLRWFTPTTEVSLCGHATLAAAHVLGGAGRFQTRSGLLTCRSAADGWIEMDFPADPPHPAEPVETGVEGVEWLGRGRYDLLAVVPEAATVRRLRPDLAAIGALEARGLIVTAPGDREGVDCVSRMFAPAVGIPEDPVTGSAHCALACYWGERLGRDVLVGEQASARGGTVRMRRRHGRVLLGGQAVTVARVTMVDP